jgi:hypothetical protein
VKEPPVSTEHAGWSPKSVGYVTEKKNNLPLQGFEPQTFQPVA